MSFLLNGRARCGKLSPGSHLSNPIVRLRAAALVVVPRGANQEAAMGARLNFIPIGRLGCLALAGALTLAFTGTAGAARFGPGSGLAGAAGQDAGERLNIATRAADVFTVTPGTYSVQSFSYNST